MVVHWKAEVTVYFKTQFYFRMLEEGNCHKSSKRVWGRGLEGNVLFDEVKWKLYAL